MKLRPGARLWSEVCDTEVIVVRAPAEDVVVECGGSPMAASTVEPPSALRLDPAYRSGTQLGKRYADEALGLEVLCTKAGEGSLAVNGTSLNLKEAKLLPSSD